MRYVPLVTANFGAKCSDRHSGRLVLIVGGDGGETSVIELNLAILEGVSALRNQHNVVEAEVGGLVVSRQLLNKIAAVILLGIDAVS